MCVCVCVKLPPGDFNSGLYPPTPYKHLFLWNDYRIKGVQFILSIFKQGLY